MGTIKNASAIYGLSASGDPTKTNVGGSATIGTPNRNASANFTDATITYSFKITATVAGGSAKLDLITGLVGTVVDATVEDGDGNDFEGIPLQSMSALYAILFETPDTVADVTTIASTNDSIGTRTYEDAAKELLIFPNVVSVLGGQNDVTITLVEAGDSLTVTVLGK